MTTLVRGMVVDINLNPVKGSETGKIRPCVIVTNNQYNARVPVIEVVPLTAWSEKKGAHHHERGDSPNGGQRLLQAFNSGLSANSAGGPSRKVDSHSRQAGGQRFGKHRRSPQTRFQP